MGYTTTRFQKSVDPNLLCGVCGGVLESPVLTPCGHTFCDVCISEWLKQPCRESCPECRAEVTKTSQKPVLSLRNMISSFEVFCEHRSLGCEAVFILDQESVHGQTCAFTSVVCTRCGDDVIRCELSEHQKNCIGTKETFRPNFKPVVTDRTRNGRSSSPNRFTQCPDDETNFRPNSSSSTLHAMYLLSRIKTLEIEVTRLLKDLNEVRKRNADLFFQNRKLKIKIDCNIEPNEFTFKEIPQSLPTAGHVRSTRYEDSYHHGEPSHGFPQGVARMSLFIARYLLHKPDNVDNEMVFRTIKHCFESRFVYKVATHDVHMLLATAYASNWFSGGQRDALGCWLQRVLRCRDCTTVFKAENSTRNVYIT